MGKTKYHVACMLRKENGRGFLSDGSETKELSLHPLFEEYHAQVGG
jgi:hypothetical protein